MEGEETYTSKLALFQKPYVESSVDEVQYIVFLPTSTISDGSVIEFRIPGTSSEYVDLQRCRLKVKLRIVDNQGTPIIAEDQVGLVNLSLSSIFRQVDVQMQEKLVSSEINICYPYKAIIDVLLKYGFDVKEGLLQSELYYKDTGVMDAVPPGNNSGLAVRTSYTANGNEVTLEGPIHTDLFQQDRLILNGMKIVLKFHPSSNKFALMTGDSEHYKVSITSAVLKVCHVKVNDAVIVAQNEALNLSPALYPYWKSNFKTISIPSGVSTVTSDDIFHGEVPSKLVLAMVKTQAFSGDYGLNPFNFVHSNVNWIELSVDGQSVPGQPLKPNFETGDYTSSFLSIFFNNYPHQDGGNWISREEYANGYSLFCFDIQGEVKGDILGKKRAGYTKLVMNFASPTPNLMLILYSSFPSLIKIDKTRNVILE